MLLKGVARGPFNKYLGTQTSAGGAGEVLPTLLKLYFAYIPTAHTPSPQGETDGVYIWLCHPGGTLFHTIIPHFLSGRE